MYRGRSVLQLVIVKHLEVGSHIPNDTCQTTIAHNIRAMKSFILSKVI